MSATRLSPRARRIAAAFPSFRDFVDAALFHPDWGYYATGRVRFGASGDYETYPDALSPLFGEMVAAAAFARWRRCGEPARIEVAEIGAGNGQLCLDVVTEVVRRAARSRPWQRFADAFGYRIFERSPALVARQRRRLRGVDERVVWQRCDLSRRVPAGAPFAEHGFLVANEVLDCLAHHKIVPGPGGEPAVVFVVPVVPPGVRARGRRLPGGGVALDRAELDVFLADPDLATVVRFEERPLPVAAVPGLRAFLRRQCPELFVADHDFPPYFACPAFEPLLRHAGALYRHAEALWIDYGELRPFHLSAPEVHRVFAGSPGSGRSAYDAPGREDITFLVDFSTVAAAARAGGWEVARYGPQADLVRLSGVRLDAAARERIVARRGLRFLLALCGADDAEPWRRAGVTWPRGRERGETVRADVSRALDEFSGRVAGEFKLMVLRR